MNMKNHQIQRITFILLIGIIGGILTQVDIFANSSIPFSIKPKCANIIQISDNHRNIWQVAQNTNHKLESGENLRIFVQWSENMTGAVLLQKRNLLDNFNSVTATNITADLGCDGTTWSNFTIPISFNINKYCQYQVIARTVSSNTYVESITQKYEIYEFAQPGLITQSSIIWTALNASTPYRIQLNWSVPTDNVGIDYYIIYRKSATDGVPIDVSTATHNFTSTDNYYIDNSLPNLNDRYMYAIQGVDFTGSKTNIAQMPNYAKLDFTAPTIANNYPNYYLGNTNFVVGTSTKPEGIFKVQLVTDEDCVQINGTLTNQGGGAPYTFTFTKDVNIWEGTIDLNKPRVLVTNAMIPGTYDLTIILVDLAGNTNSVVFSNVITIKSSSGSSGPGIDPVLLYAIIGGVSLVAVILIVMVLKKKKSAPVVDSDLEMTTGPAKKKRGKVYSGASSIGRASGMAAEQLQERRGVKDNAESVPKKKTTIPKSAAPSSISSASSARQMKHAAPMDDLDELLSTTSTPGAGAMAMRQAESNVDTTRRIDFTIAKLSSLDQNLMLMNLLLNQTAESENAPKKVCSTCRRTIPLNWPSCAFCVLDQHKDEIIARVNQIPVFGSERLCPVCRKIMHPNWSKCPYCLTRN
jgi:hypothetical protein